MGAFIQNNTIWVVPLVSILLTIVVKIRAKPDFVTLGYTDYLDFGFDLCISAMIVLLTGIYNELGIWLLVLSFLVVTITSIIVTRVGWNREINQQNILGVVIPDVVGIILLVLVTQYMGGAIQ